MNCSKKIAYALVLIGALNWGLIGVFGIDLVTVIAGNFPMIVSIIYVLIGLSALYLIISMKGCCSKKKCSCNKDVCTCDIKITKSEEPEVKMSEEESMN